MLEYLAAPFILYFYETVVSSVDKTYKEEVNSQGLKLIDNLGDYMQLLLNAFRGSIIEDNRSKLEVMKILKFLINSFLENESSDNRRKANHLRIALVSVLDKVNQIDLGEIKNMDEETLELLNLSTRSIREQVEALKTITDESIIVKRETIADEAFVANLVTFTENITDMLRAFNEGLPEDTAQYKYLFRDSVSLLIKSFDYTQGLQPISKDELPEWLKQICLILKSNPEHLG